MVASNFGDGAVRISTPILGAKGSGWLPRILGRGLIACLGLASLAGVVVLGFSANWTLPRFFTLAGAPSDDWCTEHGVPESVCVECDKEILPKGKEFGWCRRHGVHECPLCHPQVCQTLAPLPVTAEDLNRADRALAFAARTENNSRCKLHERRIQFTSAEIPTRLGIAVKPVTRAPVSESVQAQGEIVYDPTRVARLAARAPGTVWRVYTQVGEKIQAGQVLALIDAAAIGKAKAEYLQALVEEELGMKTLANLRDAEGAVPGKNLQVAEASLQEAMVRLLTAGQTLANLGLPIDGLPVKGLTPGDQARAIQFLGLPPGLAKSLAAETGSSNLIAVVSPFDGQVVGRTAVVGEAADTGRALFTVADTRRMRLNLRVRLEDAGKLRPGQAVRFLHEGHPGWDAGRVAWISPAADEKTRAVSVRVDLQEGSGPHHANTFGTAQILLRQENDAVVVPSEAVHWEGDCNVVFVRDRNYDQPGSPKVFHVRKVRPGVTAATNDEQLTEIIAGLLPGEIVATANSGILRTELLKNNLGEG